MEDNGLLDPLNELHLYVLHLFFLPTINKVLNEFTNDWNYHPLSSEHNRSPIQLCHIGLSQYERLNPFAFDHIQNFDWDSFGIDEEGPCPLEDEALLCLKFCALLVINSVKELKH